MNILDAAEADDLEIWRGHPVTQRLIRGLRDRIHAQIVALRSAAGSGTMDRMRYMAGRGDECQEILEEMTNAVGKKEE